MDSLITASARALAAGDVLNALKHVALRDDPPALALRGIAMAQLGEHARARELLRTAARRFGTREDLSRARCIVAEAEVAMIMRDLGTSPRMLMTAMATLEAHGDRANAMQARLVTARKHLLLGRLKEAEDVLRQLDIASLALPLVAVAELTFAELFLRLLRIGDAQAALARAQQAADRAQVPVLHQEVLEARAAFNRPAARKIHGGEERILRLDEVATLLASNTLVIDACRHGLVSGETWLPLAHRPILFALVRALAEAWPNDIDRAALIACAFRTRHFDESHRARLRVEIGRLRALIAPLARIEATERGFILKPNGQCSVALLAPPVDGDEGALIALLSDGIPWSTSALALALGASQRTVQRALAALESAGQVRSIGRGRAQRWLAPPLTEFTTILLLPVALSIT
ncbi:MAG TPA: helix-turn-helix domain-containing protein [Oxalicibacterium sp.]|nr:helix-turn-helix domain-containing protein [Oxalicibacterium sp.]